MTGASICDDAPAPRPPRHPVFEPRERAALLAELAARLPGFVPEWRPLNGDGDAGAALLEVYARYLEILGEGLNRLPQRSLLAFLDLFGAAATSAQSARVPLVFTLLPNSPAEVELPARSGVAARPAPAAPSALAAGQAGAPAPLFYTAQTVALARAQLLAVRSVDPATDCYSDASAGLQTGFTIFDERTPVAHLLYFGHDQLFALTGSAEVELSLLFEQAAWPARVMVLEWDYLSQDGWLPLQLTQDGTARFNRDGSITLAKSCGPDASRGAVDGRDSYWIRASLAPGRPGVNITAPDAGATVLRVASTYPFLAGDVVTVDGLATALIRRTGPGRLELAAPLTGAEAGARLYLASAPPPLRAAGQDALGPPPRMARVLARLCLSKRGLQAEQAFCDAAPLDLGGPFYPFGQQPAAYTTFYLSNEEAFALAGARVTLRFALAKAGAAAGLPQLSWEYFDGANWQALGLLQDFLDTTAALTGAGMVRFDCPADWAPCEVHGSRKRWLRARLDGGDYGQPMRLEVVAGAGGNPVVTSVAATLAPPVVAQLRLEYTLAGAFQPPQQCLSCNDFVFRDHAGGGFGQRAAFTPFIASEERERALHFGYSERLPAGLASTYVALAAGGGAPAAGAGAAFAWEYLAAGGWTELPVRDESNGFTASGMLQWVAPSDAVASAGFGGTLYRIRARLRPGRVAAPTAVAALWPNAVWGLQGETVQQLVLGDSDGTPGQGFAFRADRVPVLPGETIEVCEWRGGGDGWQGAVAGVAAADLRFERDAVSGAPTAAWVRWRAVDTLVGAAAGARVCLLERAAGLLRFGGGEGRGQGGGRIPPAGARVTASFATGGGIAGNVAAGAITELRTGVAYLQGVSNPVAASGGAASETLAAIEARAPQQFRHRGRSVSYEDYEWLARQASPDVARVRCLPLAGPDGGPQRGRVGLLLAPQSSAARPAPTVELARRVSQFLGQYCPAGVARGISVAAPRYVAVGVHASVAPLRADDAARVEQRVRDACDAFLHPLTGGADGNGWQFGQPLYLSQLAALLDALEGVDYCAALSLGVGAGAAAAGDRVVVGADAIVAAGRHDIRIELAGSAAAAAPAAPALVALVTMAGEY